MTRGAATTGSHALGGACWRPKARGSKTSFASSTRSAAWRKGRRTHESRIQQAGGDDPAALPRAGQPFPHEFKNVYGDELLQVTEDAIEPIWRQHGVLGLMRLLLDIAIRV